MPLSAAFTLTVVLLIIILLATDRLPADMVMFGGLAVLMVSGVVAPHHALSGFANPATATIAVLLLVAEAALTGNGGQHHARMVT